MIRYYKWQCKHFLTFPNVKLMVSLSPKRHVLDAQLLDSYNQREKRPWSSLPFWAKIFVRAAGLQYRAQEEYFKFRCHEQHWYFPALPQSFDGLRVLHLSDLHLGLHPDFLYRLSQQLGTVTADLCLITGDFVDHPGHPRQETAREVQELVGSLDMPVFGSPGNHDTTATLEAVQDAGVKLLVNRRETLHSGGETLSLCGLDDPHYYRTHCWQSIEGSGFRILLAHSPEIFRELQPSRQISLCLSGHTHGGQIRLPLAGAVIRRCKIPHNLISGPWRAGATHGYTSNGTGASALPMRLNCPPEIVVHILHRRP
jgi:predicted MPP superfamily phosphohydrolase